MEIEVELCDQQVQENLSSGSSNVGSETTLPKRPEKKVLIQPLNYLEIIAELNNQGLQKDLSSGSLDGRPKISSTKKSEKKGLKSRLNSLEIEVEPTDQERQKSLLSRSESDRAEITLPKRSERTAAKKRNHPDTVDLEDGVISKAPKKPRFADVRNSLLFKANEKIISDFMKGKEYSRVLAKQGERKPGELSLEEKRCLWLFLLSNDFLAELFNPKFWEVLGFLNFLERSDLKECFENVMRSLKRDMMSELEVILKGFVDDEKIIATYNLIRTTIFLNCTN